MSSKYKQQSNIEVSFRKLGKGTVREEQLQVVREFALSCFSYSLGTRLE